MGYKLKLDIDLPGIVDHKKLVRDIQALLPGNALMEYEVDDLDIADPDEEVEIPSHYYSTTHN